MAAPTPAHPRCEHDAIKALRRSICFTHKGRPRAQQLSDMPATLGDATWHEAVPEMFTNGRNKEANISKCGEQGSLRACPLPTVPS